MTLNIVYTHDWRTVLPWPLLQVSVESLGSNESQLEIDMCCGLPENSGLSGTGKIYWIDMEKNIDEPVLLSDMICSPKN